MIMTTTSINHACCPATILTVIPVLCVYVELFLCPFSSPMLPSKLTRVKTRENKSNLLVFSTLMSSISDTCCTLQTYIPIKYLKHTDEFDSSYMTLVFTYRLVITKIMICARVCVYTVLITVWFLQFFLYCVLKRFMQQTYINLGPGETLSNVWFVVEHHVSFVPSILVSQLEVQKPRVASKDPP